tara:strand:- start:77 stop:328 length:252 start_codon:yes stop_codon:yes gene_type:complete
MKNRIIEAISLINPDAQVSVSGDDINSIVWENGTTPISKSDIETKLLKIPSKEEEDNQKADNKKSAQNKLKALGLTDAEIEAL